MSVLQTHYKVQTHLFLSFCSLGHSFISPTSDFRKTKRKYGKKAFSAVGVVSPLLPRHASLIALGHQSLFTSVSFHRPLRQQSSSSSFFILLSPSPAFCVCAETKRIIFLHWLRRKGIIKKHLHY